MKWLGRKESSNMEDRRTVSGGKIAVGGGVIAIIVLLFNMFMGGDSTQIMNELEKQLIQPNNNSQSSEIQLTAEDKEMGQFVSVILADTEEVWSKIFKENGLTYEYPKLVLFRNSVETACGGATSASGPFYCPSDKKVYMDLAFFEELKNRFGAQGGDFAVAYVIGHEIGHHVQNLLGTATKINELRQEGSQREANQLSVAIELQADFYAGLWTHYSQKQNSMLEPGDIEEALSAANAVGDDAIQSKTQGQVVPDSFTHGTSKQRMYWFNLGFKSGDLKQGAALTNLN